MPFTDYLDQMNRASWVIDACGFGDLTHRLIESFGIGVPVIRPRLKNSVASPLLPGVHYLDCGSGGANLAEVLEIAKNDRVRQAIIDNAFEWYQANCTQAAVRRLLNSIIERYLSGASTDTLFLA